MYLTKVPTPHSVVQTSRPYLGTIWRDINTAGSICVPLELTDELLVVEVPYRNGSITTAAKAGLEKEGRMVREGRREEGERVRGILQKYSL